MNQIIDLPRMNAALAALDKLVADNPDRVNHNGPRWSDNLDELDKVTMGTHVNERAAKYRERLRGKGYQITGVNLTNDAHQRLIRLANRMGVTHGEMMAMALEHYENSHDKA